MSQLPFSGPERCDKMSQYLNRVYPNQTKPKATPQNVPLKGRMDMVRNNAGGYVFPLSDWQKVDQFLILGTSSGTYYVEQKKLTRQNAETIERAIKSDGPRVVARIVEVSKGGLAPSNDPAIFALAMCAGIGDDVTRKAALQALPEVCRIGTHLYHFVSYVEQFRGWGRGLREAVGNWYTKRPPLSLVKEVTKYTSRDNWSARDVLRLSHPKPTDLTTQLVLQYITKGTEPVYAGKNVDNTALSYIYAVEMLKRPGVTIDQVVSLIGEYKLPREVLPTEALNEVVVWDALLPHMGLTAIIRNLATMTKNGVLKTGRAQTRYVIGRLTDAAALRKERVHPVQILSALYTYKSGHGQRGTNTWTPVNAITEALSEAFYAAYAAVEPTNKRVMVAVDWSGSMMSGEVAGIPGLTPMLAGAANALVTVATEPNVVTIGFDTRTRDVPLQPNMRLDEAIATFKRHAGGGGTDIAQPILHAQSNRQKIDAVIVYTDSETWAGRTHVVEALARYRQSTGIATKLIVVAMVANGMTVADGKDPLNLQVVGFDTNTPQLISNFISGKF